MIISPASWFLLLKTENAYIFRGEKRMKSFKSFGVSIFLLVLAVPALAQRADRGTITGVVTDPTGNSIPRATVKVRNDDTGVVTDLVTNDAGAYSTPTLVLGTYTITTEVAGFKTAVRQGIRLVGGQIFREDVTM